jgi:DNA-binding transcriptional MerR regulator
MVSNAGVGDSGRRSGKSPDAFRTISEVSKELDVPQHVLRFWETKFTQIKPLKRAGGRRYYRPDDIELLRRIQCLLYTDGYTIKGVQKMLRENGVKSLLIEGTDDADDAPEVKTESPTGSNRDASSRSVGPTERRQIAETITELEKIRDLLAQTSGN